MEKRAIKEINKKIENGEAQVLTAEEVTKMVLDGETPSMDEVDVVTTATCGIMSGTAAVMHFNVSKPGKFKKADKIYLNGVPGFPGPCPNENLGSIDLFIYGTSHSRDNPDYGGGFLLHDLLNGEEIKVIVESTEGYIIETKLTIDDLQTARMIGTRMAFKNYTAFVNPGLEPVSSIFNAKPMEGPFKGISFSGCGELNPIQNDPRMETISRGSKVLLNGAEGLIIGEGTRSTPKKPNLMIIADMYDMNPYYIGGFRTAAGPEIFNSIAVPIPILSERILKNTFIENSQIPLPVLDVRDRSRVAETDYGSVWEGDERPSYYPERCADCDFCIIAEKCPTLAFDHVIDMEKCFGCGMCANSCPNGAFEMKTGKATLKIKGENVEVPVVCRQSDIKRAKKLAEELKVKIERGDFTFW